MVEEVGNGQHKWNIQTCPAVRILNSTPSYTQALAGAEARLHGIEYGKSCGGIKLGSELKEVDHKQRAYRPRKSLRWKYIHLFIHSTHWIPSMNQEFQMQKSIRHSLAFMDLIFLWEQAMNKYFMTSDECHKKKGEGIEGCKQNRVLLFQVSRKDLMK